MFPDRVYVAIRLGYELCERKWGFWYPLGSSKSFAGKGD